MVSNLKSETSRANGAKSRGPTTDEGKEKSSRNAIKHGLTAGSGNILLDCESQDEFDEVQKKLLGIHAPATPAEKDIVEEMIAARWRTRRMWTIETNLLNVEILTQQSNPSVSEGDPGIHLAMAFRTLADDSRSLALASRYEARLQRVYDRAYKTLRELQQTRKSAPKEPHTIEIKWFNPNPTVSEGESSEPAQPAPETELRNEPTAAATKGDTVAQPFVPEFRNAEQTVTPSTRPPSSDAQYAKSDTGVVTTPARPHNEPIEAGELQ
jgi:hypothetical protein